MRIIRSASKIRPKTWMLSSSMTPSPSATYRPMKTSVSGPMATAGTTSSLATVPHEPEDGETGQAAIQPFGGLIGCMHSVGATGIMQVFEIACHLWNRWAEIHGDDKLWKKFNRQKPSDWTDLQVKGAKRALAISHAGVGSHVTATNIDGPGQIN